MMRRPAARWIVSAASLEKYACRHAQEHRAPNRHQNGRAAKGAEEALQGWIEVSAEHGDGIPPPSELDAIAPDPDVVEAARVLVRTDLPDKAARVTITMPESLLAEADLYAKRMGFTRSGLLAQAVRERMRRDRTA